LERSLRKKAGLLTVAIQAVNVFPIRKVGIFGKVAQMTNPGVSRMRAERLHNDRFIGREVGCPDGRDAFPPFRIGKFWLEIGRRKLVGR
jgi:hypothetical protein